jgi:hypothetical protein
VPQPESHAHSSDLRNLISAPADDFFDLGPADVSEAAVQDRFPGMGQFPHPQPISMTTGKASEELALRSYLGSQPATAAARPPPPGFFIHHQPQNVVSHQGASVRQGPTAAAVPPLPSAVGAQDQAPSLGLSQTQIVTGQTEELAYWTSLSGSQLATAPNPPPQPG